MSIPRKKKLCANCQTMQYLWRSNPPTCKDCHGRSLAGEPNTHKPHPVKPIKVKPKPTVNGKPIHTALYMAAFGYGDSDFIPSELSGQKASDTHHIICRGSGGTKTEDRIENLMALTREEHLEYGDKKQHMVFLFRKHLSFLLVNGVKFDMKWIEEQIEKYS